MAKRSRKVSRTKSRSVRKRSKSRPVKRSKSLPVKRSKSRPSKRRSKRRSTKKAMKGGEISTTFEDNFYPKYFKRNKMDAADFVSTQMLNDNLKGNQYILNVGKKETADSTSLVPVIYPEETELFGTSNPEGIHIDTLLENVVDATTYPKYFVGNEKVSKNIFKYLLKHEHIEINKQTKGDTNKVSLQMKHEKCGNHYSQTNSTTLDTLKQRQDKFNRLSDTEKEKSKYDCMRYP